MTYQEAIDKLKAEMPDGPLYEFVYKSDLYQRAANFGLHLTTHSYSWQIVINNNQGASQIWHGIHTDTLDSAVSAAIATAKGWGNTAHGKKE